MPRLRLLLLILLLLPIARPASAGERLTAEGAVLGAAPPAGLRPGATGDREWSHARQTAPALARVQAWDRARAEAARVAPAQVKSLDAQFGVPTILRADAAAPVLEPGRSLMPESAARAHLVRFAPWYRLSDADVAGAKLRHVIDNGTGGIVASFTQTFAGIEVFGEEANVLMNRQLGLIAITGSLAASADDPRGVQPAFTRTTSQALAAALADRSGAPVDVASLRQGVAGAGGYETWSVGDGDASAQSLRVKRVWYHEPEALVPAYYVEVMGSADAYSYVISADDGSVLQRHSLMANDAYTYRAYVDATAERRPFDGPQGNDMTPHPTSINDFSQPSGFSLPSLFSWANSPLSTNDPWLPSGATVTTGNNVDAYADLVAPDGFSAGDLRGAVSSPGAFTWTYNPNLAPNANNTQIMGALTNLFYVNNWLHDQFYDAGFNEASGNAQSSNYGRGGLEGDPIHAEGLDYAGANNSDMATPADGASPRMQMYTWLVDSLITCSVSSPASIAGSKIANGASTNPTAFSVSGSVARMVSGSFSSTASTTLAMGTGPEWVAVADVSGDGKLDLLSANYNSNDVSVRLGTGSGAFAAPVSYPMGTGPFTVMTGDLNNDGKPDLVCANYAANTISVRLGTGAGVFGAKTDLATGVNPAVAVVGRINADGNDDIVVANQTSNTVSVFLGDGAGGFANKVDFATGVNPNWVAIGDVNRDGKADLVTANVGGNSISVLLGNGSGGFGAKTDIAVGVQPLTLSLADLNGDGKLDVVVANYFSNTVGVLLGNGSGGFGAMTTTTVPASPVTVTTGDVTGDGIADVEVCCDGANQVLVLANDGTGAFATPVGYTVGTDPFGVAYGDVTGDGNVDLVSADFSSNSVTVLTGLVTPPATQCPPYTNSFTNRIVLCDFTGCTVATQILAAQARGAVAALVRSPTTSSLPLSLDGSGVTIPVFVLAQADANAIANALKAGTPVSVAMNFQQALRRDGTVDNQLVAHEWAHHMSNRLIANANGLTNQQGAGMGEGWSDFVALLLTARSEDAFAPTNPTWNGTYSIGGYLDQSTAVSTRSYYYGIRRYPYSTDMTKNPLTMKHVQSNTALPANVPHATVGNSTPYEVHNVGEFWCSALWECYASLLRDSGRLTFDQARDRMKRYLVTSLALTPPTPTFTEARDAMLLAAYANDPTDYALFSAAFAKRGLGVGAVAPPRTSVSMLFVIESFVTEPGLSIESVALSDTLHSCDHDGYLDSGEEGVLSLTIRHAMTSIPLPNMQLTVTSNNAALSFPNGNSFALPPLTPGGNTTVSVPVWNGSVSGLQPQSFHIVVSQPGLPDSSWRAIDTGFWGNADDAFSNVDSVEARQPNWSFVASSRGTPPGAWRVSTIRSSPLDRAFTVAEPDSNQEQFLISPPIQVGSDPFGFTFQHAYKFYSGSSANHAGGVVEVSADGGVTWTDVGTQMTPAYPGSANATSTLPIFGRKAFVGTSPGYPALASASVSLGTSYAGKTVLLRFRFACDLSQRSPGWIVDDIALTGALNAPFRTRTEDTTPCSFLAVGDDAPAELAFAIAGANPVRGNATFRFALPQPAHVRIGLFDVSGRRVALLADGDFAAGRFAATWHRSDGDASVGPGVYFARMEAGGQVLKQRMVVLER